MTRINLSERIQQGVFFLDGAMGTQLFLRGIEAGQCNEALNISAPDVVHDVHNAYLNAGSDAVITNTFGCNRFTLERHGFGDKVSKFAFSAAEIARQAAGPDRYVLGDIGPCGDFLEPLGCVKAKELRRTFTDLAESLENGGVDGFIIETMTALDEVSLAIEAIQGVSELPIFVSLAFDPVGDEAKTMMGIGPNKVVETLADTNVAAIGYNCGTCNMSQYITLTEAYSNALSGREILLLAEPNAGKPDLIEGEAVYNLPAGEYADSILKIQQAGARIIGGCCGTSPEHIAAAVQKLRG